MGKPAARMGDLTAHGGTITLGLPTLLVGKMPASALGDMHVCPMCTPAVPPIPHVGGPITLGSMGVLMGKKPAARISDMAVCVGPPSMNALGCFTVLIGEAGSGSDAGSAGAAAEAQAAKKKGPKAIEGFPLAEPPGTTESHEIRVEFVDSAGRPLSGVFYRIEDPDKVELVGVSNLDGLAIHGGYAKAGSFSIQTPAITKVEWSKKEISATETVDFSIETDGFPEGSQASISIFGTGLGGLQAMIESRNVVLDGKSLKGTWDAGVALHPDEEDSSGLASSNLDACDKFHLIVCIEGVSAASADLKVYDNLEIELTGDGGKPRKDVPFTITLRDGSVLSGRTDGQGKAKHEKLARGGYQVEFGVPET